MTGVSRRRLLQLGTAAIVLPTLAETIELSRRLWPGYSVARDGPNDPLLIARMAVQAELDRERQAKLDDIMDLALQTPERRFKLTCHWLNPEGQSAPIDPAWLRISSGFHQDDVSPLVTGLPDPPPGAIGWRVYAHCGDAAPVLIAAGKARELSTARALQRMDDGVFV